MSKGCSPSSGGRKTHPHGDAGFHFSFPFPLPLTSYSRNIKGVHIARYGLSFCSNFSSTSHKELQQITAGLWPTISSTANHPPRVLPPHPASFSKISQLLELLCPVPAKCVYNTPLAARLCRPTQCRSLTHPGHCFGFPGFPISLSTLLSLPPPPHPLQLLRPLCPCAFQVCELPQVC